MDCSIEVSMYPLTEDYENQVLSFLRILNETPNIKVETNGISTQIFGSYQDCMQAINNGIELVFQGEQKAVFNMKILKGRLDSFDKSRL